MPLYPDSFQEIPVERNRTRYNRIARIGTVLLCTLLGILAGLSLRDS